MKFAIVLACCVAAALAAPADSKDAVIAKYDSDNIGVDSYSYGHETSNGIAAEEQGQLNNAGPENEAIEGRGQFSYTGPDGVSYAVTYIANEDSF